MTPRRRRSSTGTAKYNVTFELSIISSKIASVVLPYVFPSTKGFINIVDSSFHDYHTRF